MKQSIKKSRVRAMKNQFSLKWLKRVQKTTTFFNDLNYTFIIQFLPLQSSNRHHGGGGGDVDVDVDDDVVFPSTLSSYHTHPLHLHNTWPPCRGSCTPTSRCTN